MNYPKDNPLGQLGVIAYNLSQTKIAPSSLSVLAFFAKGETLSCRSLAEKSGYSERQAQTFCHRLKSSGHLEVARREKHPKTNNFVFYFKLTSKAAQEIKSIINL